MGLHSTDDGSSRVVRFVPHAPTTKTRLQVERLAAFGLTESQIAYVLGCTQAEVRRYYATELEHGLAKVTAQVANQSLEAALAGDTASQRFWLQTRGKWAPAQAVEHRGEVNVNVAQRQALVTEITQLVQSLARGNTNVAQQADSVAKPAATNVAQDAT